MEHHQNCRMLEVSTDYATADSAVADYATADSVVAYYFEIQDL